MQVTKAQSVKKPSLPKQKAKPQLKKQKQLESQEQKKQLQKNEKIPETVESISYGRFKIGDKMCYWVFGNDSDVSVARMQHDDFDKVSIKDALKNAVDGMLPLW